MDTITRERFDSSTAHFSPVVGLKFASESQDEPRKYLPADPYRALAPGSRRVDFYEPSFVRGPQR